MGCETGPNNLLVTQLINQFCCLQRLRSGGCGATT